MWSFFWSAFSCIQSKYREIRTSKISVFGHFSRSERVPELQKSHLESDRRVLFYASNANTNYPGNTAV